MTEPHLPRHSATSIEHHSEPKWVCDSCGFVYDPAEGDPYSGIPANTPFSRLPAAWHCPECGADKDYFIR